MNTTPKTRYGVRKVGDPSDYIRPSYQAEELNARHEGREPMSYSDYPDTLDA